MLLLASAYGNSLFQWKWNYLSGAKQHGFCILYWVKLAPFFWYLVKTMSRTFQGPCVKCFKQWTFVTSWLLYALISIKIPDLKRKDLYKVVNKNGTDHM